MSGLELHPLMPEDEPAARALLAASFAGTRYEARTLEQFESALQFEDPEYVAILAHEPSGAGPVALALFGTVAGARQCVKLHLLAGSDDRALAALATAVVDVSADAGERLVVCEAPDDEPFARTVRAALTAGFVEEGRVPDYVADGVALRLLVWRP